MELVKDKVNRLSKIAILVIGIILGLVAFVSYKVVTYSPDHTHYHANFAVYINGEKEKFESPAFYEELTGCSLDTGLTARGRAHMHEPENGLVHVHDEAVTWGNFFENIGMSVGRQHVGINTDVYVEDDSTPIEFVLNGEVVNGNIATQDIANEDRLLVVIGASEEESLQFFDSVVPANAAEFNQSADPGTCSSSEGHSFTDKIKEVIYP